MRKRRAPARRLGASDWEEAAVRAIESAGVEAVRVESLARELGVTKGSFYWHFRDRADLLGRVLRRWEKSYTEDAIRAAGRIEDPAERLRALLRGKALLSPRALRIHAALRMAITEPLVRRALRRATRARLAFLARCYRELGVAEPDASLRARLQYAAFLGRVQLDSDGSAPPLCGRERERYLDLTAATLLPCAGRHSGRLR